MKNKIKKAASIGVWCFMMLLLGCGAGTKNTCTVSVNDNVIVTYNGEEYVVLNERVEAEQLGQVVGGINKVVSGTMFSAVYEDKENDSMIDISIDSYFVKAVKKNKLQKEQVIYKLEDKTKKKGSYNINQLSVNPNNGTQLISDTGEVYQVTDEEVFEEEFDQFLTTVSAYVVYDGDTKKVISQKELSKIDWNGKTKGQKRVTRVYTEVYNLKSDVNSIGVNVNEKYLIAKLVASR